MHNTLINAISIKSSCYRCKDFILNLLKLSTLCLVSIFVTFAIILVCSFPPTGSSQTPPVPRPAHSALSDPLGGPRPEPLKVAHDEALWPFSFKDKTQYEGFEPELWAKVAAGMDIAYLLVPMPFTAMLPALENGEIDIAIAAIPVTPSRKERVEFSIPYYRTGLVALCKRSGETLAEEQSPANKKKSKEKKAELAKLVFSEKLVAVQKNSAAEDYALKNIPEAKLKVCTYREELFFELLAGRVDMVFAEQALIEAYLNTTKNNDLVKCSEVFTSHNLAIALPKESTHLKELNKSLKLFRSSEEFKALCLKWFGTVPNFRK